MDASWQFKPGKGQQLAHISGSKKINLICKAIYDCNGCDKQRIPSCACHSSYMNNIEYEITVKLASTPQVYGEYFQGLLFNKDYSDLTIIHKEVEYPVHKVILAAHSPVFRRMFTSEFKEKSEKVLNSELDVSTEVFKELLKFMYTESSQLLNFDDHIFDLLHASDYYEIESLKEICESYMLKHLDTDNANDFFQYAHLYKCGDEVKRAAFDKIKETFKTSYNQIVPSSFYDDPEKVQKLISAKSVFEEAIKEPFIYNITKKQ